MRGGHTTELTVESSPGVSDAVPEGVSEGVTEGDAEELADGSADPGSEVLGEGVAVGLEDGSTESGGEGSLVGDSTDDGPVEGEGAGGSRTPVRGCAVSDAVGVGDSEVLGLASGEVEGSELVGSTEGSAVRDGESVGSGDTDGEGLSSPGAGDVSSASGVLLEGEGLGDSLAAGRISTHGKSESADTTDEASREAGSTANDAEVPDSTKAVLETAARKTRSRDRTKRR